MFVGSYYSCTRLGYPCMLGRKIQTEFLLTPPPRSSLMFSMSMLAAWIQILIQLAPYIQTQYMFHIHNMYDRYFILSVVGYLFILYKIPKKTEFQTKYHQHGDRTVYIRVFACTNIMYVSMLYRSSDFISFFIIIHPMILSIHLICNYLWWWIASIDFPWI